MYFQNIFWKNQYVADTKHTILNYINH